MIKDSYNNKVVNRDYTNKLTDYELKTIRNKCRDFLNKSGNADYLKEVYKLSVFYGMK